MPEIPNVLLSLSGSAENVLLVRQALNGLALSIDLDPLELNDVNTAVSEACNNVVVHAYGGESGPLEVDIYAYEPTLRVVVRDHGNGIPPPGDAPIEKAVGGIGLPVIHALTHDVELRDLDGEGTEVRMEFATARTGALEQPSQPDRSDALPVGHEPGGPSNPNTITIAIAPTALARTILPRVLSALAARAHFTTDRISDTQLLADTLLAHTDEKVDSSHLNVTITAAPRELNVRIGPLRRGGAEALIQESSIKGLGEILAHLADGHEIRSAGAREILELRVAAEPGGR
jgi:anti-sigma regulatory factor (Ser/Thr protein kinase)